MDARPREVIRKALDKSANKISYVVIGLIFIAFIYFGTCFFKFQELNFNVGTVQNNSMLSILMIAVLFLCILSVWNICDRKVFEKKILTLIVSVKNDIANAEDNIIKVNQNLEEELIEIYDKLNARGLVANASSTRVPKK